MSRLSKALATAAAAALAVPVWAGPAAAETSTETASNGAYFYAAGIDKPDQSPAAPPNLTGNVTDGVAEGHLAAAVRVPNREDKKSFLFFDLLEVGFEGTVQKAVVTVPLAENGNGNTQMSPAPEKVQACPADATGFAGEDGASFAGAPATQCDVFAVKATANEDGTAYLFDVTAMAASWVSEANNGMGIVPADLSAPFQVVFKPFAEATIEVEYTPGADSLLSDDVEVETFGDDGFSSDLSSTDSSSGFDSGSFDSGSLTAAESLGFGAADLPAIDSELALDGGDDGAVPEPAIAGSAAPTRAVAAFSESLSPTTGLIAGGVLLALLLAGLSLIMGDPQARVATAGAPSRLAQALQSRDRVRGLMSRTSQS